MIYWLLEQLGEWLTRQGLYRYVMVLEQQNFRVFCSAIMSFALVVLAGKRVIRWLSLKKIGDSAEFNHAQLNEMIGDPEYKIGRPRQLFIGSPARDVKPLALR